MYFSPHRIEKMALTLPYPHPMWRHKSFVTKPPSTLPTFTNFATLKGYYPKYEIIYMYIMRSHSQTSRLYIYEFRLFPDFYSFVYFVDIHFRLVAKNRCVVKLLLNRNLIINKW